MFIIDAKIDGNPVAVALKNDKLKDGAKVYKVAEVASVYDLENSLTKIANALRSGNRKYIRKNEVARLKELLHGGPIPLSPDAGYAPLDDGQVVTIQSDDGPVNIINPALKHPVLRKRRRGV